MGAPPIWDKLTVMRPTESDKQKVLRITQDSLRRELRLTRGGAKPLPRALKP